LLAQGCPRRNRVVSSQDLLELAAGEASPGDDAAGLGRYDPRFSLSSGDFYSGSVRGPLRFGQPYCWYFPSAEPRSVPALCVLPTRSASNSA